jgi:hypothetical protein
MSLFVAGTVTRLFSCAFLDEPGSRIDCVLALASRFRSQWRSGPLRLQPYSDLFPWVRSVIGVTVSLYTVFDEE